MKRLKLSHISPHMVGSSVTVCGWVKTLRAQKMCSFIELTDGSTPDSLQMVLSPDMKEYDSLLKTLSTGASLQAEGVLVQSPGGKQTVELQVKSLKVLGMCPEEYPLQKKRHSFEFLRTIAHLRARTNTQGAILRLRSLLSFAVHSFFQERGFFYVQTPIITTSDCEGGGEQFHVTTLKSLNQPVEEDFFKKKAYLTVSGQLNGEALALALSDIYTFGPTFRAENSNTSRHLAEFWMIEPEMAFADLEDNIECAESFIRHLIKTALSQGEKELAFFDQFIESGLILRLESMVKEPFVRMTYTEAVSILEKEKKPFVFPVSWGIDLQSEHERFLTEEYCKKPVILTDYPRKIKAFYMRDNPDGKTVAAVDILVPKIGEIIGGSQREERLEPLLAKMKEHNLDPSLYEWYLELRKYGSAPHAGFGMGFERFLQLISGLENIRDVIPFPRFPGNAEF